MPDPATNTPIIEGTKKVTGNFQAPKVIPSCGSTIQVYARRTVTVNGQTISFIRGPIGL